MRFAIDILHPAHVHFFKHFHQEMQSRGHEFLVTSRDKDVTLDLLDAYGIDHIPISTQKAGPIAMATELVARTGRFVREARKFKPDVLLGIMGPVIALSGKVLPARTVVFYDNESARAVNRIVYRLADQYCTPRGYAESAGKNHIRYDGYHELAYLHPNRFKVDKTILSKHGLDKEPLFVIRFVSWESVHDVGEKGLSRSVRLELLKLLGKRGRVVITSESKLPTEFEEYRLAIPVEDIHHVLAAAHLLVGESSTMASEAAVLGTHALFVSKTGRGINDEQEANYGLVHNFNDQQGDEVIQTVRELLELPDMKQDAAKRLERLLANNIDVTTWMVNLFDPA
jgi:uncharacterized protein